MKMKRIPTTASLQTKLDKIFSVYIRRRDSDKSGNIRCITCTAYVFYKDADACHFVSRQYLKTRYDERNVHAGCRKCNRYEEGRKEDYALFLLNKFGSNIIAELNEGKHNPYIGFKYEEKIEYYKQKVKELENVSNY